MYTKNDLESILKSRKPINNDDAFIILQSMYHLANTSTEDNSIQQILLRILDRKEEFKSFNDALNGLIRHFGLYPYLYTEKITIKDAFVRELHRPSLLSVDNSDDEGIVFHKVQSEIFQYLMNDENIILSAPTSFGKSTLIDSLIESKKYKNIIIVVPTIALIDETRRRIASLKTEYKIITHASQEKCSKNIFILTQERVIDFPDLPELDLFILDEFYKLDPKEDSERATALNIAFYKLYKKSKQFYLLGPNINNIPNGLPERFQCRFIKTDYSTVVTEVVYINPQKNHFDELVNLCNSIEGSTLIFCASPSKARRIIKLLVEKCTQLKSNSLDDEANWIAENYHPDWTMVKGLRKGIGMHHGRIPRAIAHLCVKNFNEEKIKFLVCTSTLIEGVNTKAKNVIIFDNKIATKKFDFFTFNNIKGRSGRMFKHFIGNVYLFNDPPQEELPLVDIPVFSQDESNTKESLLIQLDKDDMTQESWERIQKYHNQSILSVETLRSNSGINPDYQIELATCLLNNRNILNLLNWNTTPSYKELETLCCLIWDYFIHSGRYSDISSGKQLAFKLNQLNHNQLKDIIFNEINNGLDADDAVENTLNFIRQWAQFHFPRFAMAVSRIQNELAEKLELEKADYSFFCAQVENLFKDPALIALDEYGLPLPLAEKIEDKLNSEGKLDIAIDNLSKLNLELLDNLTFFEKELLRDVKDYI